MKISRGSTWSNEETECLLDIWTDAHIKLLLENTHNNADALNTQFDQSATV